MDKRQLQKVGFRIAGLSGLVLLLLLPAIGLAKISPKEIDALYQKFVKTPLPLAVQESHKTPLATNDLVEFWSAAARKLEKIIGTQTETLTIQLGAVGDLGPQNVTVQVDRGLTLWTIARRAQLTYEVMANRNPFYDTQSAIEKLEEKAVAQKDGQRTPKVNLPLYVYASAQLEQALSDARYKAQAQLDTYQSQIESFQQFIALNDGQISQLLRENQMAETLAKNLPVPLPGGIPTPSEGVSSALSAYEPLFRQAFQTESRDAPALLRSQNAAQLSKMVLRNLRQLTQTQQANAGLILNTVTSVSKNTRTALAGYRKTLKDNWAVLGLSSANEAQQKESEDIGATLDALARLDQIAAQQKKTQATMKANLSAIAQWENKLASRSTQLDSQIEAAARGQNWTSTWDQALVQELTQNRDLVALIPSSTDQFRLNIEKIVSRLAGASPGERVELVWNLKAIDKNLAFNAYFITQTLIQEDRMLSAALQASPNFQKTLIAETGATDLSGALSNLRGGVDLQAQLQAIDGLRRLIAGGI